MALVRPAFLVGEMQGDGDGTVARRLQIALGGGALVGEVVRLADVEIEVDRIERNDRGQQRCSAAVVTAYQVADADPMAADPPRYGCCDLREFHIELRRFDPGLGGFNRGCRDL